VASSPGAPGRGDRHGSDRQRVGADPAVVRRDPQPSGDRPRRGHGVVCRAGGRPGHPGSSRPPRWWRTWLRGPSGYCAAGVPVQAPD